MTRLLFFRIATALFGILCLLLTVGALVSGLTDGGPGGDFHVLLLTHGAFCGAFLATGFLSQLRRPSARVASWQMLLVTVACMELVGLTMRIDDPLFEIGFPVALLVTGLLHPARRRLLRPGPVNRLLVVVAVLCVVPSIWFTVGLAQHLDGLDGDALLAAQAGVDAVLTIPLVGLVAGLRAPGWRMVACSAGTVAVVFGVASIAYPAELGSAGAAGGTTAILAGLLFVALAESLTAREGTPSDVPAPAAQVRG